MAAMKPRTGDGPMEVTKEGRGIVMRVPLEGGGRLVVEMTPEEADTLAQELKNLNGLTLERFGARITWTGRRRIIENHPLPEQRFRRRVARPAAVAETSL